MGRPAGPTRDTKALICERALDVFAEKGYTASTMRDIAHGAGMKDASLYNHFPANATCSTRRSRCSSSGSPTCCAATRPSLIPRTTRQHMQPTTSTNCSQPSSPATNRSFQTRPSPSCDTSSKRSDTPIQASFSSTARYSSRDQSSCRRRSSPSSSHADTSAPAIRSLPLGNSTERCS